MSNDLETQVKDLASALELAQYLVSTTLEKHPDDIRAVYRAEYTRAGIEARLRRAEQDLAVARPKR
jgi:hypothetical protein